VSHPSKTSYYLVLGKAATTWYENGGGKGKKERKRKKRKGERKDSYSRIPIAEQEKITYHVHSDKCLRIYLEK
jgi:hypothetical protein